MVKSERRRLRLGKEEGDAIEMEKIRGLRFWGRASGNFFKNTGAAERVGAEELSAEERKKRGLCPWRVETQLPMVSWRPTAWFHLSLLRSQSPLIQCITNFISLDLVANTLLASGASRAMVSTLHVRSLISPPTPMPFTSTLVFSLLIEYHP